MACDLEWHEVKPETLHKLTRSATYFGSQPLFNEYNMVDGIDFFFETKSGIPFVLSAVNAEKESSTVEIAQVHDRKVFELVRHEIERLNR